ncbi:MAG TPA: DUF6036 family nucleotidyltransferase [Solirubrobacteraceae bacterium]|nr:DUF6036 family nucleotidyltransferase [Solirubrobacteraceae bacterium]
MTRREIPIDAAAILRVLAAHEVEYVVIGGLAVQAHGHPRTTQDLDLIPEPTPENRRRLLAALTELGARPVAGGAPGPVSIPETGVLELDTDAGGIDVHAAPPGAAPYAELRARALMIELDVRVAVAGRDDLIAMKRARGRPIDRSDIIALTEP